MRYFTDNPLERLMTQTPKAGGEGRPLPAPEGHFCYGCGNYGGVCIRPCYRDAKNTSKNTSQRSKN